MNPYLRLSILALVLLAGPAAGEPPAAETAILAEDAVDGSLSGPVAASVDGCSAFPVRYRKAMAACLQDIRSKTLMSNRLGAAHSRSAAAGSAQMAGSAQISLCQAQIGVPAVVVE